MNKGKYLNLCTGRLGLMVVAVFAAFTMSSCADEEVFNQTDKTQLSISVNTGMSTSRALINDEYFPGGTSIGLSLYNSADGKDYDNQGYSNVKFTAAGDGANQTWSTTGAAPSVSANEATLVAYYPYAQSVSDLHAIPVETASQTDYMFSGQLAGINNTNADKVNITMYHALTAVRVQLVLGDYSGNAAVSDVSVASPALGTAATLDAATGTLASIAGKGDKLTLTAGFTLVTGGTDTYFLMVPDAEVTSGTTTVSATIGNKKYTAGIDFYEYYKQGYIYTYVLTLNNSGFTVTKVAVNPWETGDDDNAVLQPEGPKILQFYLSTQKDCYYGDEPDENGDYHKYYNYTQLSYVEGMTILDWLDSKYNTLGITYESDEWGGVLDYNNNSYNCIYVMDNQDNKTDVLWRLEGLMRVIQPNDRYVLIIED